MESIMFNREETAHMLRNASSDDTKLSLVEAAPILGVSPHTLRAWTRERRIPFYRNGRRIVFAVPDLERFLADNRIEARER